MVRYEEHVHVSVVSPYLPFHQTIAKPGDVNAHIQKAVDWVFEITGEIRSPDSTDKRVRMSNGSAIYIRVCADNCYTKERQLCG